MADNEAQTTDVGHVDDVADSDSGIGTGSATSTPSQSVSSTPSQSEMSTPLASPTGSQLDENLQFPPGAFPDTAGQANESDLGGPSAMEVDSNPRSPLLLQKQSPSAATATKAPQMDRQGSGVTTTNCPQMDRRGFFTPADSGPSEIQIFVRNFGGQLTQMQISPDASVTDLRKMVHDKMGVPPSQQRLNYQGREFQDGEKLRTYGVQNLSEINLLGRLRGGRS